MLICSNKKNYCVTGCATPDGLDEAIYEDVDNLAKVSLLLFYYRNPKLILPL